MDLAEQLRRDEGERRSAYQDSRGFWSIGVGICIDSRAGCGLDAEETDWLLNRRISKTITALSQALPWTDALDDIRLAVLCNMAYNLGIGGLSKFDRFLGAVQIADWNQAKIEMLNSLWAKQLGYDPATPLNSRPGRLAAQIVSGSWI